MYDTRRDFIKKTASLGLLSTIGSSALLHSGNVHAGWPRKQFAENKLQTTLAHVFADQNITPTDKIRLKLPRIAENGAVVPITVSCDLKEVESIHILVENNPIPLAIGFTLTAAMNPVVSARIKMAKTCDVIAIVNASGQLYSGKRKVKVTLGGCGG